MSATLYLVRSQMKDDGMRLYGNDWSLYPRRVQIYLSEKGLTGIEHRTVDLLQGENREDIYLQINPCGTLPTLRTAEGETVRQSMAIIFYLEELHPEPNLMGATPLERAVTNELLWLINDAYLYRLNQVAHQSPAFAGRLEQCEQTARAMAVRFEQGISDLEALVTGGGPYLTGRRVTVADCVLFASEQYLREFYGRALPARFAKLNTCYDIFAARPSARLPDYPASFREMAALPAEPVD